MTTINKQKTEDQLISYLHNVMLNGEIEEVKTNFFVVWGSMTEEYVKYLKEALKKSLVTSGCSVNLDNTHYFSVTRKDGTTPCVKFLHKTQRIKGVRWEYERPNAVVVVCNENFDISEFGEFYTGIAMTLHPRNPITVEIGITDEAE